MPPLTVSAVLSDAGDVYHLLFRRSFPIALGVYAVIGGFEIVSGKIEGEGAQLSASVLAFILSFAGPILVQGALVKIVRSVHEGTRPEGALALLADANSRLLSLVGAALISGFGIILGLILLIVPGLMYPGQRMTAGARMPPSQVFIFEPLNGVVPPSGKVNVSAPLSVVNTIIVLSS